MYEHDRWDDEDEPELVREPPAMPAEARRMGLTKHTEEGALVAFASSLDGAKLGHKFVAWLMLLTFVLPALLMLRALI
jgi:hypothetical protein